MGNLPYQFGVLFICICVAFFGGYLYGRSAARYTSLQNAMEAWQKRRDINHETDKMDDIDVCVALGGLRQDCTNLMRRMASGTGCKQTDAIGKR